MSGAVSSVRRTSAANNRFQKHAVNRVLRPVGVLRPDKRRRARDRDDCSKNLASFGIGRDVFVREAARASHEIHEHLIGDANDDVITDVGVGYLSRGGVSKHAESLFDAGDVLRASALFNA